MSAGDIFTSMRNFQRRHGTGQQPAHVTIRGNGVLCGAGTPQNHVAGIHARQCAVQLGRQVE